MNEYRVHTLFRTIITDEDNNENANEQIAELITRKSFASKNNYYNLTCQC